MSASESGILIGWATESITPDKPAQLMGQFYERVSEYVRDPVMATALAIEAEGGSEQAVIEVGKRATDLAPDKVLVATTHTHTAPVERGDFYPDPGPGVLRPTEFVDLLVERTTQAIVAAWESRAPGGISWALSHAAVGFNRRVAYDDGVSQMYGNSDSPHFVGLEGTQDHAIELLFCWDASGDISGIVINPACPSQVVENKRFISADYWSAVRDRIHEQYGERVNVLALCSAAGDQSPRDLVRRGRGEPNMRDEDGLEEIGRRIARAVRYVAEDARRDIRTSVAFSHVVEDLELPARSVTDEQAQEARKALAVLRAKIAGKAAAVSEDGDSNKTRSRAGTTDHRLDTDRILERWEETLAAYETQADEPTFGMELHVLRLGDIVLATNPFELFLDYGLRIKARSRAEQVFLAQLTCGWGGYLPTEKAVSGGGYGASITDGPVGPEGGEVLVERTLELANGMWE